VSLKFLETLSRVLFLFDLLSQDLDLGTFFTLFVYSLIKLLEFYVKR